MSAAERPDVTGIERNDGDIESMQVAQESRFFKAAADQLFISGDAFLFQETDRGVRREAIPPSPVVAIQLGGRFEEPGRFGQAAQLLENHRSVLLDGEPGSGRRTAASRLLHKFGRYRILSLADQESREELLNPEFVQPGKPLLLDLSDTDDVEAFVASQDMLLSLRTRVVDQEAALVVIPPTGVAERLRTEWGQLRVTIKRPDGAAVLAKYLSAEGISCGAEDLRSKGFLHHHLVYAPMRELARICRSAVDERESDPDASPETWLRKACAQLDEMRRDIACTVQEWAGDQRALALSAAVLQESHADSVHRAAVKLRERLKYPNNDPHVLEQKGLDNLLGEVEASANAHGEVSFPKSYFASAVRAYFWKNFPTARSDLREWIGECVLDQGFSKVDRHRMIARFAEQARMTGRSDDLCELAWRLTSRRDGALRSGTWAASALAYGIQDDSATGFGATVRRRIYEWCSKPSLKRDLAQVLVTVCAEVMSEAHPDQAIVRLRLLAMHDDAGVVRAATEAVVRLTEDPRFYRRFLWRMRNWLVEGSKKADVELFLAASPPSRLVEQNGRTQALVTNRGLQRQLVVCWSVVFAAPAQIWVHKVQDWLKAAAGSRQGSQLLDLVVEGAGGERANLALLHVAARDWAADTDDPDAKASRLQLTRSLAMKIDAAQGLQLNKQRTGKC